jgi:hypothetical protein
VIGHDLAIKKGECMLNQADINLVEHQPPNPACGPENEVNDGPKNTVVDLVTNHGRNYGQNKVR